MHGPARFQAEQLELSQGGDGQPGIYRRGRSEFGPGQRPALRLQQPWRQIDFVSSGLGGFNNNLSGSDARSVTAQAGYQSGTSDGVDMGNTVDLHTDAAGAQTYFVSTAISDHFQLHLIYTPENPPDGLAGSSTATPLNPASLEYDWDTQVRVKTAWDGDAAAA